MPLKGKKRELSAEDKAFLETLKVKKNTRTISKYKPKKETKNQRLNPRFNQELNQIIKPNKTAELNQTVKLNETAELNQTAKSNEKAEFNSNNIVEREYLNSNPPIKIMGFNSNNNALEADWFSEDNLKVTANDLKLIVDPQSYTFEVSKGEVFIDDNGTQCHGVKKLAQPSPQWESQAKEALADYRATIPPEVLKASLKYLDYQTKKILLDWVNEGNSQPNKVNQSSNSQSNQTAAYSYPKLTKLQENKLCWFYDTDCQWKQGIYVKLSDDETTHVVKCGERTILTIKASLTHPESGELANPDSEVIPDINNDKVSDNNSSPEIREDKKAESYRLIDNDEDLIKAISSLQKSQVLAIDTETTGLDPHLHRLRLIQIASPNNSTIIIDCFKCDAKLIQPLLINNSIKIFHNAKFDLQFFLALGLEINQRLFDTQLAYQLINAGKDNLKASLKAITKELLNKNLNKDEQISDWSNDNLSDRQLEYAAKDAEVLLPLREKLRELILAADLGKVAKIEFDCVLAVAMMEFNGMLLHLEKWQSILKDTQIKKEKLEAELKEILIRETNQLTLFNTTNNIDLDSPKQVKSALNNLGIKVENTSFKTLAKLAPDYEVIKLLLEYRKLSKLLSSFGDSLTKKINPVTGRLHASYWQCGSSAGRFSCTTPNLQQIPRNKETRSCFIASPSYKLVIADYSQIELRIAAELTNDKTMLEAYNRGEDLHKLTASIILDKPLEEVTKSDRQIAKSANFGLIYGSSIKGFRAYAESNYGISLSEKEASKIMNNFFKSYQGLSIWHKNTKSKVYNHQISEARTLGKRRRLMNQPSPQQALNTPVQGTGADILKLALAKLPNRLKGLDAKILATVHDEIILEAHESIADKVAVILSDTMEEAGEEFLKLVPVKASASIGDNWADK